MIRHPGLIAIALAALALPVGAQISGHSGSTGPSDGPTSPFFPAPSPTLFTGGPGYVPPDAGTPGDGDDGGETPGGSPTASDRRAVVRGTSSRASSSSTPTTRATASQGVVDPGQFGIVDSWLMWWETNKFDFIQLHRIEDSPLTGQGRVVETDAQRAQRLADVATLIEDKVLPTLRRLTASNDPAVRAASIVALAKVGDRELSERASVMLDDGSFAVRRAAMLALGIADSARGSYQLISIVSDTRSGRILLGGTSISDDDRGTALLTAALRGGENLSLVLVDMLAAEDDLSNPLLTAACEAAGLSADPRNISTLTAVARDSQRPDAVRAAAITALGRIADPAVVPTLLAALDEGVEPRRAAAVALGLAAHGGLDWVVEHLIEVLNEDRDAPTRHFAAISLGRLAGDLSRQALLDAFVDPASDMRPWLALGLALCERKDPQGQIPALLAGRLDHEANVDARSAYLVALGLCGGNAAVEALSRELSAGQLETGSHAALALGLTGHPDAGVLLRRALAEATGPVMQRRAALGLGVLGNSSAVPSLVELIRDTPNPDVASYAALGIGYLGDENAIGPLLQTIDREDGSGLATTYSVVAVGQLFDSERRPALSRLAAGDNYLARSDAANQLLMLGF